MLSLMDFPLRQESSLLGKLYPTKCKTIRGLINNKYFRGHVHPLITGFPKAKFRKFGTELEAEAYMQNQGTKEYVKITDGSLGDTTLKEGEKAYYAVANGRSPGIQEFYL
jgi:hypothetical protein